MTEQLTTDTPPVDPAVLNAGDPPADDVAPQPEVTPEPSPSPRMIPADVLVREVTPLRAKNRELESALEEHRRRDRAQQELIERLQRNGSDPAATPSQTPRQPEQQVTQADIDRRALELNFQRDAQQVSEAGLRAYGGQWRDAISIMESFGLNSADFVSSVIEVAGRDKTHELVHALAQQPEQAATLASMSPARRIAEITRMSERLTAKPAAAAPAAPPQAPARQVSKAPPPAPPVNQNASKVIDWNTDQDKMSDADWSREWNDRFSKRTARR